LCLKRFFFEYGKVIGFALTTLRDWSKNSRQFFIQSAEVKPKPIVTRSHTFSRASHQLHVTTYIRIYRVLSLSFVIGLSDSFGFVSFFDTHLKTALLSDTNTKKHKEPHPMLMNEKNKKRSKKAQAKES